MKFLLYVIAASTIFACGPDSADQPIELGAPDLVPVVIKQERVDAAPPAVTAFDPNSELGQSVARWQKHRARPYTYSYKQTGFSPSVDVTVTVKNSLVVKVETETGAELEPEYGFTVDELLARIANQLDDKDSTVSATYQSSGAPLSVYFDEDEQGNGFDIEDFRFLGAPVQIAAR